MPSDSVTDRITATIWKENNKILCQDNDICHPIGQGHNIWTNKTFRSDASKSNLGG